MRRWRRWLLGSLVILLLGAPGQAQGFARLMVGMELPPVDGTDVEGRPVRLADHRGKRATVVLFWATWSDNSLPALRRLAGYREAIAAGELGVVTVNVEAQAPTDEEQARVAELTRREKLPFPVILDRGLERFHRFGVVAVPSAVLLDGEGRVDQLLIGYPLVGRDTFLRRLDVLLGKRPAAAKGPPVARPPAEAVRLTHLAERLLVRDRRKVALEKLGEAIAKAPGFLPAYRLAGRIHLDAGDYAAAAASAKQCLTQAPEDA
ncbi:MAG: TlpA family protein disulfide reductase, partial [Nitrospirae bacterium]